MTRAGTGRATRPALSEIYRVCGFWAGCPPSCAARSPTPRPARSCASDWSGRAAAFLELVRRAVYERGDSPYRALLREAGCEFGDLARLVRGEGVEGALRELLRRGVYLTVAEFKGRVPVRRGGTMFTVDPARLRNAAMRAQVMGRTSGSRGDAGARAHGSSHRA